LSDDALAFSQHAAAPNTSPTPVPTSTRCPSISQDITPATAGMMQNSMATAAAPCRLIARTYSDNPSVALSRTTPATAITAMVGSYTANGVVSERISAGTKATAFCTPVEARKSTSAQKRC
jgi:hypothetical protein